MGTIKQDYVAGLLKFGNDWWKADEAWTRALGEDLCFTVNGGDLKVAVCDVCVYVTDGDFTGIIPPGPFEALDELIDEAMSWADVL